MKVLDSEGLQVFYDETQKPPLPHPPITLQPDPSLVGNDLDVPQTISLYGVTFEINGDLQHDDVFTYNVDFGVGDNKTAVALSRLKTATVARQGTQTLNGSYTEIMTTVGTAYSTYDLRMESVQASYEFAVRRVQEESGVVLDEEAADMIKYQQIYQASAQVINTAGVLIETLLQIR